MPQSLQTKNVNNINNFKSQKFIEIKENQHDQLLKGNIYKIDSVPVRNKIPSRSSSATAEHSSKQKISDTIKKRNITSNHVDISGLQK